MSARAQDATAPPEAVDAPRQDLLWPYYTRILAVIMVVLIHTVAGSVIKTSIGSNMWWGAVLLDSAASWAVPVFVMMSGALLLAPGRWSGASKFYQRRAVKIGVPTVAWIAIYISYRLFYLDEDFGVTGALKFTLAGYPAKHLFYLFVILGLYAITPLLRILVEHMTQRQVAGLTAAWLFMSWFNAYIGITLGVPSAPNAVNFFIPYVGYFLAGYVLRNVVVRGLPLWLLVAGIAATIVGEAVEAFYLRSLTPLYKFSALTIVMSLMAFVVLLQLGRIASERGYTGRVAKVFAAAAFGVYLVHPIVTAVFTDAVSINLIPATVGGLFVAIAVTIVLSWALILVVLRIPLLKRLV